MIPPVFRVVPGRLALAAALLAAPVLSQTEVLVATGDSFPSIGIVDEVLDLAIDETGDWLAVVHGDGQLPNDMALVQGGVVVAKSGDALVGSTLGFTRATRLGLNGSGSFAWVAAHPASGSSSGQGVYLDLAAVAEVGDGIQAPGITPGTTWLGFWDAVLETSGSLVVHGYGNDTAIVGIHDSMLVRFTPAAGGGWSETLLSARGQTLPGGPAPILDFAEFPHGLDVNAAGQVMSYVRFQASPDAIYVDATPLAMSGGQSPIFGRSYSSFFRMPLATNDAGDTIFGANLGGDFATRQILVWNGIKLAQQGDQLSAIAPFTLTGMGLDETIRPPLHLTDQGQAVWYGTWDDNDLTKDAGLFLDQQLWIAEGKTWLDGSLITDLVNFTGIPTLPPHPVFDVTNDGEQVALRATLADGRTGAFRLRPKGGVEVLTGCVPNAGLIEMAGAPVPGGSLILIMKQSQVEGALGFGLLSGAELPGPCGTTLPGVGEVLIDLSPAALALIHPGAWPAIGGQTLVFPGSIPSDPTLAGQTFYAQGMWLDVVSPTPAEPVRLTNGLAISFGH